MNIILRELILAAAGAVGCVLGWGLLNTYLWWPYSQELRATGWIHVHDVGVGLLMGIWPWALAIMWLLGFWIWRYAERRGWNSSMLLATVMIVFLPAMLSFSLLHFRSFMNVGMRWHYPGLAIVIGLVGALLIVLRGRVIETQVSDD